jgi:hypothetical protein
MPAGCDGPNRTADSGRDRPTTGVGQRKDTKCSWTVFAVFDNYS